jgi:hypothetical protein
MATEQMIADQFFELKSKEAANYEEHYETNLAQRNKFSTGAMRGPNSLSLEAFEEMSDVWRELKYFPTDNSETRTKGFNTNSNGTKVFTVLYRYLEALEAEKPAKFELDSTISVSEKNWKMTFDLTPVKEENKEEELEGDVEEEE